MHGTSGEPSRPTRAGGRPRGRRPYPAVTAALLAVISAAGCSSPSAVPLSWSAARAPLPADASGVSGQYVVLNDVSCPGVGSCVVVGADRAGGAGGAFWQGLAETLSDGAWTPVAVPDVSSEKGFAALDALSCPAQGTCVAIGFYTSAAGTSIPVIETLSGGRWKRDRSPLPADALTTASAKLNDVVCPAADTCLADGWYSTRGGVRDGYVDMLSGGTWTAASVPLPADADPEQSSSPASTYLAALACPRPSTCIAPGQYLDNSAQTEPFIATLSGGTWTSAKAALPANAAATDQVGSLSTIACPAPAACIAAGSYLVRGGQPRYLTETQSGGSWTAAALPLPADAAADQNGSQYATTTIVALACQSAGACIATASYVNNAKEILPLIETLSRGTWTAAKAPLPADADIEPEQSGAVYLQLATCPAAGHCLAVGNYPVADGTVEGLIETAAPR
jgi:hypothetical protein